MGERNANFIWPQDLLFSKGTLLYARKLHSNGTSHSRMVFKNWFPAVSIFRVPSVTQYKDSGIFFFPFSNAVVIITFSMTWRINRTCLHPQHELPKVSPAHLSPSPSFSPKLSPLFKPPPISLLCGVKIPQWSQSKHFLLPANLHTLPSSP